MKTLAVVGIVILAIASCIACNQLLYKDLPSPFMVNSQPANLQMLAPDSAQQDDKFYVSVEVVYHASQASQYPVTFAALQNALTVWADAIPMRLTVYVEDPRPPTPFFPFGMPTFLDRWNIVEILLDDLQSPPYNMQEGVLGVWFADDLRIILDADLLEKDAEMAYSVALHELGHMFGLPHLVDWDMPVPSGWIVLPPEENAVAYVMYPTREPNESQDQLSQLEINLAKHYLLRIMTSSGESHACRECQLTHEE